MTHYSSRFSLVPVGTGSFSPSRTPASASEIKDFLAFALGEEHYALPLSSIREIMKLPYITEVPLAPANVIGIISVRGRVTTLIDMRRLLSMSELQPTSKSRVLLVSKGDEVIGLLVDRVLQVYRLTDNEIETASTMGGEQAAYVTGIGRPALARKGEVIPENGQQNARFREQLAQTVDDSIGVEILILLDPDTLLQM
ncbi:MAG: chemotaxis protein CheW [Deltaproteobacteria bacterium]|nr:chemotaxis protein CheW [Deltaproteobacteria bacterium]